mmetsp:Transcript_16052/g.27068  ORF Transcript_16052/g.27068 Transcript_16052/m.27068 type:complete len:383 (-) Transcript_16052:10-1158(-)
MSEYNKQLYIKAFDQDTTNKAVAKPVHQEQELMDKLGINLEILRKIQDKKFEVDVEYEMTRDLYEKQRVVDKYLEEHWEDNEVLNDYYQSACKPAEHNRFYKHVYANDYDLGAVRFNFFANLGTTAALTASLAYMNPFFALLTLYDWFLLSKFALQIQGRTVFQMVLCPNKQEVLINRLSFLGFQTPKMERVPLRGIVYTDEVLNDSMSFDYVGVPPSIQKILKYSNQNQEGLVELEEREEGGFSKQVNSDNVRKDDKHLFKYFISFMSKDRKYLIPIDNDNIKRSVISEELLNHVAHGRVREVQNFDFSELEARTKRIHEMTDELNEYENEVVNEYGFVTETLKKKREYNYQRPSRDFRDDLLHLHEKKLDNGEFWNNGYR